MIRKTEMLLRRSYKDKPYQMSQQLQTSQELYRSLSFPTKVHLFMRPTPSITQEYKGKSEAIPGKRDDGYILSKQNGNAWLGKHPERISTLPWPQWGREMGTRSGRWQQAGLWECSAMLCSCKASLLASARGVWDGSLAEPSQDTWGFRGQRSRTCCSSQAGDSKHNSGNFHCLSMSHVWWHFPPKLPQHRHVSTTSSFPTQNAHSSSLSALIKTKQFSFLSLNPNFQANSMFFTSLFLISDQYFTAAHDKSHSHFTPLPSALKFPVSKESIPLCL